jgi:hypothetical protein
VLFAKRSSDALMFTLITYVLTIILPQVIEY